MWVWLAGALGAILLFQRGMGRIFRKLAGLRRPRLLKVALFTLTVPWLLLVEYNFIFGVVAGPWMIGRLEQGHRRHRGIPVEDSAGHSLGMAGPGTALPVAQVPPIFRACLRRLEDRHLGSLRSPLGTDVLWPYKLPFSLLPGQVAVGGSTLPMQLARMLEDRPPDDRESVLDKLGR
ncbi:MAG: hypothetical protein K2Q10_02615, partial [Rhodospirillales bacterium]|nr:hypothetical protein [Rhodospirillales bacterium]